MNVHEVNAWNTLIQLGARKTTIGGKLALDLISIRIRSGQRLAQFCQAFSEVAGRSRSNRRHVDRQGRPVFVVTDDREDPDRRPEIRR